jgi:hypothetical protein
VPWILVHVKMYLVCRSIIICNIDTNVQNVFSTSYINIYKYIIIIIIIIIIIMLYILVHIEIYLICRSITICYIDTEEQDPIIIVYAIHPLF